MDIIERKEKAKGIMGEKKRQIGSNAMLRSYSQIFEDFDLNVNQGKFLSAYVIDGRIKASAEMAGIHPSTVYFWRKEGSKLYSEEFVKAFAIAQELAVYLYEDAITERGVHGYKRGVWHQGIRVGEETHYSDNLLMFKAKAAQPEKYRDYYEVKHTHSGTVDIVNRIAGLSDEEMRELAEVKIKPKLKEYDEDGEVIDV